MLLSTARSRSGGVALVGRIAAYCENAGCDVREVEISVKEYGETSVREARCPACGEPLNIHGVATLAEAEVEAEREARRSVNAQLYVERERRRLGAAPIAIPIEVVLDDSLPEAQ
jgi:hypothetical protein